MKSMDFIMSLATAFMAGGFFLYLGVESFLDGQLWYGRGLMAISLLVSALVMYVACRIFYD